MGQVYKEYHPENTVDFYGLALPDAIIGRTKTQPMAVDEQIVTGRVVRDTGNSSGDYSIVAVFSDAETAPYAGKHVEIAKSAQTSDTWESMDEAIEFYEKVYKKAENNLEMNWENYDRKCWSLVEQSGNRIVLHWSNISGAGGSYDEFIKNGKTTQLIVYDGNASYPNNPSIKYTIQNDGEKVVGTEKLYEK